MATGTAPPLSNYWRFTGQRPGEIASLRWTQIHGGSNILEGGDETGGTKNYRDHVIPLSEAAKQIIDKLPRREGRDLIFGRGKNLLADEQRLQQSDLVRANVNPDEPPIAKDKVQLEDRNQSPTDQSSDLTDAKENFSYLAYYAYSEVPPETKPADTVLKSLDDAPRGTTVEEIKRAADAFGLDFNFMKAVAKVESDFNPKQRTGSYIGLFQLSNAEFQQYGSGDILDSRDNAVAAAYKFLTEDILFEIFTHKKPTLSDVYLIHQQGVQGAAEHVSHPDRLAWKSMCATDEGREKGERWCKRAVWGNTLPAIKHIWKTIDNVTSRAFVAMWQQRVSQFYSRYSETTAK